MYDAESRVYGCNMLSPASMLDLYELHRYYEVMYEWTELFRISGSILGCCWLDANHTLEAARAGVLNPLEFRVRMKRASGLTLLPSNS